MKILSIETSCDETAVSILEAEGDLEHLSFSVLGSAVQSQIDIHKEWGGVVPNLARREHEKNLPIVLAEALKQANLSETDMNLIVVTVGPGLEPALWVGILFAQKLGEEFGIPVMGANHMQGHIASVLIKTEGNSKSEARNTKQPQIQFPALALLISGGHTELVYLEDWTKKQKIGETRDDAVGEAFDKVARMLGLPYPGGPQISRLAEIAREKNISLPTPLPRPMIHSKDFDFSFSGLKTAVLYLLRDIKKEKGETLEENTILAIAREFEDAVIETLLSKTKKAIDLYAPQSLIIGGGVIANSALRAEFEKLKTEYPDIQVYVPEKSLTTDNATMIGIAGYIEYLQPEKEKLPLKARGNLNIA